jgi:phage terminase large subunit-like protein
MTRTKIPPTSSSTDRTTQYALDIVAGRTVAGPHVRDAAKRHLDDLKRGHRRGLRFDTEAADRIFGFFETVLQLSEGQFEGQPFRLDPSQAFILGSIFGWKRPDGHRRFRRAYIEQGKGNGKSPLAGGIGLFCQTADGEAGAEIYAAGARKEQAGILFRDAVKMVRKSPALAKRLQFSGGPGREYNIAHHSSGSFFRPISKEAGKTGSGPRPHVALCDEVHEHPDRSTMEMLERGFKFRRQPLLLMITNSGSDRNSICWEEHEHAIRVARRDIEDDTTFSFVCALDDSDDPLNDPSCWVKANPLLGVTITEEYLAGVVSQAKAMPGKLNGVMRLHFCVWTDAEDAWISREALEAVLADFDPAEHHGKEIDLGLDLSGTKDLTAKACMVQTGEIEVEREDGSTILKPTYDAWIEAWTPAQTLAERALADRAPYDVWVTQGHLRATPGPTIRLDFVASSIAEDDSNFTIRSVAYDRYAYSKLSDELDALGLTLNEIEHPQGGKRRAKPTDAEIAAAKASGHDAPEGLWMPGSLNMLEELILEHRIRLRRNPVLVSACASAAIERDAFDNRWFSKRKATQRIDPLVALAMAVGVATRTTAKEQSIYEDRGLLFF